MNSVESPENTDPQDGINDTEDTGNAENAENTENTENTENADSTEAHSDYKPVNRFDAAAVHHLSGMYQNWFLDYASYTILDRAVPHIEDGLKPVQRRILHSMKRMDDGRYNKVANIVGHTMQFHPHGDASIGDALVQLGQKDLLIDTQEGPAHRHTGKLGKHPHGQQGGSTPIHRGTPVEVCPRHGVQPQDHRVAAVLRRAQQGAHHAARQVPPVAQSGGGGHCRRTIDQGAAP